MFAQMIGAQEKWKKGPEKNAPEYPFGRGGWGVKNYLGDALMPGL